MMAAAAPGMPKVRKKVEVFTSRGRVVEDTTCECGYVFKAEEANSRELKTEE